MNQNVTFEEMAAAYKTLPFYTKYEISRATASCGYIGDVMALSHNGFLKAIDDYAVCAGDGEAYVYLWKHLAGDVFYVGSGVKNRWKSKYRGNDFLKEIDAGDALVYKVVDGLLRQDAYFWEQYLSYSFQMARCGLTNGDHRLTSNKREAWESFAADNEARLNSQLCEDINNTIINNIVKDKNLSIVLYKTIKVFRREYGDDYFSSGRWAQDDGDYDRVFFE